MNDIDQKAISEHERYCKEQLDWVSKTAMAIMNDKVQDDTTKRSNPKDLVGSDKVPMHLWPTTATVLGSQGHQTGLEAAFYRRTLETDWPAR